MLSAEQNRLLTQVGPGTPMGGLLRRYWHPVAAVRELDEAPSRGVRLLGEDLLLFKRAGGYGLVARHCPHRGADLLYGTVEDGGVRCGYHGWKFDAAGACVEQPYEDTARPDGSFKERVCLATYQAQAKAGLIWAYLGPRPAPCLWDWARFHDPGHATVDLLDVPCNWLQCQENSIDPVHFEWLHQNLPRARRGSPERAPRTLRLGFDEHEFGFIYRRVLENTDEAHPLWRDGRFCLWPNGLFVGAFLWHVPVDDEHTLDVSWRLGPPGAPYRRLGLSRAGDRWSLSGALQQDAVAMVGQGPIADRTREHLGESDRGVILLRKRFLADLERVAAGDDPKGILRDAARNHRLALPCADHDPDFQDVPDQPRWRTLLERGRRLLAPWRERLAARLAPRTAMTDMIHGYRGSALLYVAAKLGLADLLADSRRGAADLALASGAEPDALRRVLAALVGRGILDEDPRGFALTRAGQLLRTDTPGSLRGAALLAGEETMPAWGALLHSVMTGDEAFAEVFGMSSWEHRRAHPELNRAFNDWAASGVAASARRAAAAVDFSRFEVIVDVGGGVGGFLGDLLQRCPGARGILVDRAHVVAEAPALLARLGVDHRCEVVAGDFFTRVPVGADAYVLKHILHDWDDARALAILRVCREAVGDARLFVLDNVVPDAHRGRPLADADVHMLVVDGGRERSAAQLRALLARGGFGVVREHRLSQVQWLFEARPR